MPWFLLMAQPGGSGSQNPLAAFIPLVLIIVVFYFLLIRPQQKRTKSLKAMLEQLRRGTRWSLSGGWGHRLLRGQGHGGSQGGR